MLEHDHRPEFDITTTGAKLLERANALTQGSQNVELGFKDIVQCEHKYEVARCFSAFLQQINNGEVQMLKGETVAEGFRLKLAAAQT